MAILVSETLAPRCSCVASRHCCCCCCCCFPQFWMAGQFTCRGSPGGLSDNRHGLASRRDSQPLASCFVNWAFCQGLFTYLFIFLLYLLVPSKHRFFLTLQWQFEKRQTGTRKKNKNKNKKNENANYGVPHNWVNVCQDLSCPCICSQFYVNVVVVPEDD